MLETSFIHVYRRRLQTQLAAGTLGVLALTGCSDEDTRSSEEPSSAAPVVLHAESASVAAYAEEDPSWKECDEVVEFRSHGAAGPGTPYEVPPSGEF